MPLVGEWGAPGWRFLHCVSFSYGDDPTAEERRRMFAFVVAVGDVLPCKRCRGHYRAYVGAHLTRGAFSPALADRDALSRFLVDLHNDVNRRLGRPTVGYEEVRRAYLHDGAGGGVGEWLLPAAAALAAGVVVALVLQSRRKHPHVRR